MTSRLVSLLGESPYFKGLSTSGRQAVAAACRLVDVPKREHLFREGERGESVYLVAEGALQLVKTSEGGQEVVIKTVEPGDVFAEVMLFERDRYPVSAVAVRKSLVYALPRARLLFLLEDADFRTEFIGGLMGRMRYLADRILNLTVFDVEDRFFRFLEDQYGQRETYALNLSWKDVAAAIGTTPETLSRLLLRLKQDGAIRVEGKRVTVLSARPGWGDQLA